MIFPCKDCQSRYVGCHTDCEDYLNAKSKQAIIKQQIQQSKLKAFVGEDYVINRQQKWKKRKRR